MNGAPVPPNPNADPPYWFLFVLFLAAIILIFTWLIFHAIHKESRRLEAFRTVIDHTRAAKSEIERETLINQSPGGRKSWQ